MRTGEILEVAKKVLDKGSLIEEVRTFEFWIDLRDILVKVIENENS